MKQISVKAPVFPEFLGELCSGLLPAAFFCSLSKFSSASQDAAVSSPPTLPPYLYTCVPNILARLFCVQVQHFVVFAKLIYSAESSVLRSNSEDDL